MVTTRTERTVIRLRKHFMGDDTRIQSYAGKGGGGGEINRPRSTDRGAATSFGDQTVRSLPTDVAKEREEKDRRMIR